MDKIYDVIILGAGPGGLAAGLYSGRYRLSTLIIEKPGTAGRLPLQMKLRIIRGRLWRGKAALP